MALTFVLDLDRVKVNKRAKYLGQGYLILNIIFNSTVIVRTHRHTRPITLPGPLKWSVINTVNKSNKMCIFTLINLP